MSVVGSGPQDDQRQLVSDISAFPYNQVVRIWVDYNGNGVEEVATDGFDSGFLIAPNKVLTAAHAGTNAPGGGVAPLSQYHVQLGHTATSAGTTLGVTNRDAFKGYNGNFDTDVAILTLASSPNFGTQSVGLSAFAPGATMNGLGVTVAGYPGDLPVSPSSSTGHVMYSASGTLINANSTTGTIEYTQTLDTGGGQSGSGVWGYNADAKANLLYGVHLFGPLTSAGNNGGLALVWDNWDEITARLTVGLTPAATATLAEALPVSVLIGSTGNDTFNLGSALREVLFGYAGNDTVRLGLGNDWFNGGAGTDTLQFATARSLLLFGNSNDAFVFDRADNSFDRLTSVEQVQNGATTTSLASGQNINTYTTLGSLNSSGITNQTVGEAIFGLQPGVQLNTTSLVAASSSASFFGGLNYGPIHMGPGLLLTTGNGAPHATGFESVGLGLAGNPQLDSVVHAAFPSAGASHDANTLQLTFTVTSENIHSVSLSVVFASEEYPEFSDSSFVDIAAVIVNGKNYAVFNGNQNHPLSILDANINAGNFINNDGNGALPIAYDGVSSLLSIVAPVHLGQNTILIGVEDTGDSIYDSALFLTDLSFQSTPVSGLFLNLTSTINNLLQNILNYITEESNILIDLGPDNDSIVSGIGNDVIIGGLGNDTIDGGIGSDSAVFSGIRSSYTIEPFGTGMRVSGPDGVDILTHIDFLVFDDTTVPVLPRNVQWAGSPDLGVHNPSFQVAGIGDFNHDGTEDILWRNPTTGQTDEWILANGQWSRSQDLGSYSPAWNVAGIGDFNDDGNSDVLWRNAATGQMDEWKLVNGQWAASQSLGTHGADWNVVGLADFDRDGDSDVLFRNSSTGQMDLWIMNSGQWTRSQDLGSHGSDWNVAGLGDFNSDGTPDILFRNPTNGRMDLWIMQDAQWSRSQDLGAYNTAWQIAAIDDFNGDGTSDVLWRNPTTGQMDGWVMHNAQWFSSILFGSFDASYQVAGTGDFNHAGGADVLWRNPTTGAVAEWLLVPA